MRLAYADMRREGKPLAPSRHSRKVAAMTARQRTLVMAGSREAHALVTSLLAREREVIASLPEPERMFGQLPVPTRVGGFAGVQELEHWLRDNRVSTVIDASHPFDSDISALVAKASARRALRYLRVLRPPWEATAQDHWHHVASIDEAARAVPATARVFANTGWMSLQDYARFNGSRLFVRQTHDAPRAAPFPFVEFVEGSPPFTQFEEQSLFEQLAITHLICRNVGGAASMSKLLAARAMGLPVFMVARAPLPAHVHVVESTAEALAWAAQA
jgi:precorrin-6A/cobalt-precorrin-6A reductase